MNFAVNNDGDYFPRLSASFADAKAPLSKVNDGNYWYHVRPPNRWTCAGSANASDWLTIDFGVPRRIETVKLYFLDDATSGASGGTSSASPKLIRDSRSSSPQNIVAPKSYALEFFDGQAWKPIPNQKRTPEQPAGHRANTIQFVALDVQKLRAVFTHAPGAFTGLTDSNMGPASDYAGRR
jgi:hypothetical protein